MIFYQDVLKSGNVDVESVRFPNQQISLAGNVFKPKNSKKDKYPAIVIGTPSGGVKEQTAGTYAALLAEKGFLTIAFDASYQGESTGEPRFLENPSARVEDLRCAEETIGQKNDYREGFEYYRVSPAKHERSENKDSIINFTALDHVEMIFPRPILMIVGTEANTKYFSEEAFQKAKGDKFIHWIQGATHIQLYYVKKYVLEAVDELETFYKKFLDS